MSASTSAGYLTTHVLDTAGGRPGAAIAVRLYRLADGARQALGEWRTNADGRGDTPLLQGEAFQQGVYELEFEVGDYYRQLGVTLDEPAFLDTVILRFGIADEAAHYHVPLLVSPYGYSTYRGS
ncbi:hydroxyisourate hydrolase [Pseudomonas rhizoryzae]|uniref:hydroxyisourate hydrolase n=1 Tax=Pseudomonas rhizoryzae TaxID=2571129 RepID=UPI000735F681|nr:hydroxyisourate hydrolase [Pseudomonas rhizoryzae]KTT33235.1 5-hydroxyisourate hydrolase [Pseudomonas psychrotolerans]KTT34125.1 5-hydroxyisourate hydrolase [Pseudomonas psychrotolerans]KTT51717.1 5-hydroxyisourate hydrolase [Pseudomonas psychrotolerans]KTT59404.1 5-hydroxyisourate hydrolase [Pseudomonas psychrotolerans]KTT77260.1 5-hydroxyisourate hydrolase [Pseudomonas psychrotolerans]